MHRRTITLTLPFALLFLLAGLGACAQRQYVYEPAVSSNAVIGGRAASYYAIPTTEPHGDVRIASLGLVDIQPSGGGSAANDDDDGGARRAIHLRMVVSSTPAFATVDGGAAPLITIRKVRSGR